MASITDLRNLFERDSSEPFLMRRVLSYAKKGDFTKYTSTLEEAWRISIQGLTRSLFLCMDRFGDSIPELEADEDYQKDPAAAFGIKEAQLHRQRGISLSLFLALTKYYKEAYLDLISERGNFTEEQSCFYRMYIQRFYDRVEIGFASEWAGLAREKRIEELQLMNKNMTNEKNKYLTIFESINTPIILFNSQNQIENANKKAIEFFIQNRPAGSLYYQEGLKNLELPQIQDLLSKFTANNSDRAIVEKVMETADGEKLFEIMLQKMLDVSEKFSGTTMIFYDITKERKNQQALIAEKEKVEQILATIPHGIVVVYPDGEVLSSNQIAEDIFQDTFKISNLSARNLLRIENNHQFFKIIQEIIQNQKEIKSTVETIENRQWYDIISRRVKIHGEALAYPIIIELQDVTDYVEFDNLRKQFVSTVSHELRTPITSIKLSIKNLMKYRERLPEEKKIHLLEMISTGTDVLSRMIEDLLVLSRVDSQKIHLKKSEVDLAKVLQDVGMQLHAKRLDKEITIEKQINGNTIYHGDDVRLSQIFRIFLDNAIKYSDVGSTIVISLDGTEDAVVVSFKDHGIGIRKDDQEKLFKRFFRSSDVKDIQGTGLGLSIAKELTELHGGRISVDSVYGKGTTFRIYFPKTAGTP